MSSLRLQDRASLCTFTLADGRRCCTPRSGSHMHFCFYHARKESQARTADKLGSDLSYFFSGAYVSACDLSTALGRLLSAVARGDVKPKTATTLAYLAQTLVQSIHLSQHEYIKAFGTEGWCHAVRDSVNHNFDHLKSPADEPEESLAQPPALPELQPKVQPKLHRPAQEKAQRPAQPQAATPASPQIAAPPQPIATQRNPQPPPIVPDSCPQSDTFHLKQS